MNPALSSSNDGGYNKGKCSGCNTEKKQLANCQAKLVHYISYLYITCICNCLHIWWAIDMHEMNVRSIAQSNRRCQRLCKAIVAAEIASRWLFQLRVENLGTHKLIQTLDVGSQLSIKLSFGCIMSQFWLVQPTESFRFSLWAIIAGFEHGCIETGRSRLAANHWALSLQRGLRPLCISLQHKISHACMHIYLSIYTYICISLSLSFSIMIWYMGSLPFSDHVPLGKLGFPQLFPCFDTSTRQAAISCIHTMLI